MDSGYAYIPRRAATRSASPHHPLDSAYNYTTRRYCRKQLFYGTNEALLYRDVALRLVRDPAEPSQTVLLMEVTVRLWKGYREKEKP